MSTSGCIGAGFDNVGPTWEGFSTVCDGVRGPPCGVFGSEFDRREMLSCGICVG